MRGPNKPKVPGALPASNKRPSSSGSPKSQDAEQPARKRAMTLPSRSAPECNPNAPQSSKSPMIDTPIVELHRTPIAREQQDDPRTEYPPAIRDPVSLSGNLDGGVQVVDHGSRVGTQRRTRPPPLDLSMFNVFGQTALHPHAPIQPLNSYHVLDDQQWRLGRNHVGFMGMDLTSIYHNEVVHRQNYPPLHNGRARAFSEAMHMPLPVSMEIPLPPFSNEGVPLDIPSASS